MNALVETNYQDIPVSFTADGWFNATTVAERFGKNPTEWLRLPSTKEYIEALKRRYGKIPYVKSSRARVDRGGGTWLHPKLAIRLAQWLDIDFAIWCDEQIDHLLKGTHPHHNQKRARHEASASNKVLNQLLQITREQKGKECKAHHFSNEARLINFALTGEFSTIDREQLNETDLNLLTKLEVLDCILIGKDQSYEQRKAELLQFAQAQRNTPSTNRKEQS